MGHNNILKRITERSTSTIILKSHNTGFFFTMKHKIEEGYQKHRIYYRLLREPLKKSKALLHLF